MLYAKNVDIWGGQKKDNKHLVTLIMRGRPSVSYAPSLGTIGQETGKNELRKVARAACSIQTNDAIVRRVERQMMGDEEKCRKGTRI